MQGIQLLRYTCGIRPGQAFHSPALHRTRWIPSHTQEHSSVHVTLNVKNYLKRCEIGVVSRQQSCKFHGEHPRGGGGLQAGVTHLQTLFTTQYTKKYTSRSTCWRVCKMHHKAHAQAHKVTRNPDACWVFSLLERGWSKHAITGYKARSRRARLRWGKWVIVFH